jgi:hypothetical protein
VAGWLQDQRDRRREREAAVADLISAIGLIVHDLSGVPRTWARPGPDEEAAAFVTFLRSHLQTMLPAVSRLNLVGTTDEIAAAEKLIDLLNEYRPTFTDGEVDTDALTKRFAELWKALIAASRKASKRSD